VNRFQSTRRSIVLYAGRETAGALVGLEFADGTSADLPVSCDIDLLHWQQVSGLGDHARIATRGLDARVLPLLWRPANVYALRLGNPQPEKPTKGLRLAAGPGSGGAAMFLAVTLEPTPQAVTDAR
jgi:hypothetical protein